MPRFETAFLICCRILHTYAELSKQHMYILCARNLVGTLRFTGHHLLYWRLTRLPSAGRQEALPDHTAALDYVLDYLQRRYSDAIKEEVTAMGHRVVHGKHISRPVLVDDKVLQVIRDAADLAPLHNPANLQGIVAATAVFPGCPQARNHCLRAQSMRQKTHASPAGLGVSHDMYVLLPLRLMLAIERMHACVQVAVFDTAFHQTMPASAYMYAVPYEYYEKYHVRKYGFHGTSVQYLVEQASHNFVLLRSVSCIGCWPVNRSHAWQHVKAWHRMHMASQVLL